MLRIPLPQSVVGNAYPDDTSNGRLGEILRPSWLCNSNPVEFPPTSSRNCSCVFLVLSSSNSVSQLLDAIRIASIAISLWSSCRSIHRLSVLILIHVPFRTFDLLLQAVSPAFDDPLLFLHNDTHILNDLYRPIFFGWVVEGGG